MNAAASSSAEPPISPIMIIGLGLGVGLELAEAVDEVGARHRVAADADARRHADAELLELVQRLVGQRARARDDADVGPAGRRQLGDLAGGDADVALARADDAGAVRAEQAGVGKSRTSVLNTLRLVLGGDALGDAHHERDARRGGLEDGGGRGLRRHGDERGVGAGGGDGSATLSYTGMPSTSVPPLPGVTPADDLGAVGLVAQAVVPALPAGEALHDHLGGLVDEDRHRPVRSSLRWPPLRAASSMVGLAGEHFGGDAGLGQDLAPFFGVGAVEADHDRRPQLDPAERLDDAVGHLLAAGDAAEDVDEDALHVLRRS